MPTPGTSLSHHARLMHFLIQDAQGDMKSLHGPPSTAVPGEALKIEYIPLSSSASSVHVLQERMTVWWLPIPAIWLCKPTEGPLTAPPQRRNIDCRRFSEGSCCFFRTLLSVIPRAGTRTVPPAPTPDSLSKSITARTRVFWNEDLHGDCQPQNPPSILGHDPCAVCLLHACTKPH